MKQVKNDKQEILNVVNINWDKSYFLQLSVRKYTTVFILLLICNIGLYAQKKQQKSYQLICVFDDKITPSTKIPYLKKHKDTVSLKRTIANVLYKLQQKGYVQASVAIKTCIKNTYTIYYKLGKRLYWDNLSWENLDETLIRQTGLHQKKFKNQAFDIKIWESIQDKLLVYSENNGYPFASVKLDSIEFKENKISAQINYQKGKLFTYDTLTFSKQLKIKQKFLQNYLKLKKGQAFNQSSLERSTKLLKLLPFITVQSPSRVSLKSGKAYPILSIQPQKASQIDLIVGFLPNEEKNNQLLFTGNVDISLFNLFRSGIDFNAQWQRLKTATQKLKLSYLQRTIRGSNFAFEASLNLLKQDTSLIRTNFPTFHLKYRLPNTAYFVFGVDFFKSRILGTPEKVAGGQFNTFDLNYNAYSIGYEFSSLDNFFSPRIGSNLSFQLMVGNKIILQNANHMKLLSENITPKSTQVKSQVLYHRFFKLSQYSSIMIKLNAGVLLNQNLLANELFQLGGLNSLRGHNENSFFASSYGIFSLEYRLFFEEESYIFAFYDQAYLQKKVLKSNEDDTPLGFGFGLSFKTKAGVFNFVYGLGNAKQQEISFKRSKIHFGLTSRF